MLETLGLLPRWHGDQQRFETGVGQRQQGSFAVEWGNVPIRNDGTALAELEFVARRAELTEQTFSDLNRITSLAQPHLHRTHNLKVLEIERAVAPKIQPAGNERERDCHPFANFRELR